MNPLDKFEKDFKEKLDQGQEYNHSSINVDWTLYKMHSTGVYYVQRNEDGIPEGFDTVEQAVYYLLMRMGYWKQ